MREVDAPVTPEEWSAEVRRAIAGKRDSDIAALGIIGEYFDVLLANADDPELAEIHFHRALEQWLQYWHPMPVSAAAETAHALDLLSWFTPPGGIDKALQILAEWPTEGLPAVNPTPPPDELDLHMRALEVLEQYFTVPPSQVTPAYTAYLKLLDVQLEQPQYREHALARQFSLGALKPDSAEIGALLDDHPAALDALLQLIFRQPSKRRIEDALTNVYAQCFERSLLAKFDDAITNLGGVTRASATAAVIVYGGETFVLKLEGQLQRHTWASAPGAMSAQLDRALARATKGDEVTELENSSPN